jgi:hypothetical protein
MQSPNSLPLSEHVYYMLNREYFNMLRAEEYISACARLPDTMIIRNDCDRLPDEPLPREVEALLPQPGIDREESLSAKQTLIARKRRRSDLKRIWRLLKHQLQI